MTKAVTLEKAFKEAIVDDDFSDSRSEIHRGTHAQEAIQDLIEETGNANVELLEIYRASAVPISACHSECMEVILKHLGRHKAKMMERALRDLLRGKKDIKAKRQRMR